MRLFLDMSKVLQHTAYLDIHCIQEQFGHVKSKSSLTSEKINRGGRISGTSGWRRVVDCAGAEQRTGAQQFRCNYDMKHAKVSHRVNPFFYLNWPVSERKSSACSQTMTFR